MTPAEFVKAYHPFALEAETNTGMSALAILAQAALESGWGKCAPGNMFFGVKDNDGMNGNEQLLTTTEFSRRADLKFPVVLKVVPVIINGSKLFKYTVKDYFRKYDTPADCFTDHANFLIRNARYAEALKVKHDPYLFVAAIAKAGYATDPNYASLLTSIINSIKKNIARNRMTTLGKFQPAAIPVK